MKITRIVTLTLLAGALAACGTRSPVGTVDVSRIIANWSTYQNDQMALLASEQAIAQSKVSNAQKQREAIALQKKYENITLQLTEQIKAAASKVAQAKQLKLVVTRAGVGYGGTDITPDVEKAMNIVEKPSPAPSSS